MFTVDPENSCLFAVMEVNFENTSYTVNEGASYLELTITSSISISESMVSFYLSTFSGSAEGKCCASN